MNLQALCGAALAALLVLPVHAQQVKTVGVAEENGGGRMKAALATVTAGYPDYSEAFAFGWSGRYVVRVLVTPKCAAKPVEARFAVNRAF